MACNLWLVAFAFAGCSDSGLADSAAVQAAYGCPCPAGYECDAAKNVCVVVGTLADAGDVADIGAAEAPQGTDVAGEMPADVPENADVLDVSDVVDAAEDLPVAADAIGDALDTVEVPDLIGDSGGDAEAEGDASQDPDVAEEIAADVAEILADAADATDAAEVVGDSVDATADAPDAGGDAANGANAVGCEIGPAGDGVKCGGDKGTCSNGHCFWLDDKGYKWTLVPAGTFWMGCNAAVDNECQDNEKPQHLVDLSAYWIGVYEVTVTNYKACNDSGEPGCSVPNNGGSPTWGVPGKKQNPLAKPNWLQSESYCKWLGGDLPTEAQWEKAAKGGCDQFAGKDCSGAEPKYPWGNSAPVCGQQAVFYTTGAGCATDSTFPVGTGSVQGQSPFGVYDMAGNVFEWCLDWYDIAFYGKAGATSKDAVNADIASDHVLRGGAFSQGATLTRASFRYNSEPSNDNGSIGLRCARPYFDPICGNNVCEAPEATQTCPKDCPPPAAVCGDGKCDAPAETCTTCAKDCGSCAGESCLKSGGCFIADKCFAAGVVNPAATCAVCDVTKATDKWTVKSGACLIGGACFATGTPNPVAPDCSLCDPAKSSTAWSVKAGFCAIDGNCVADGKAADGSFGCKICDAKTPNVWTIKLGISCDDGLFCTSATKCDATGACVGNKVPNCCTSEAECANMPNAPDVCQKNVCNKSNGSCAFADILWCCASGVCCDVAGKTYKSKNTVCNNVMALGVEYRCNGQTVEKRNLYPGCTGASASKCSGDPSNLGYGDWVPTGKVCNPEQLCTLKSPDVTPSCEPK